LLRAMRMRLAPAAAALILALPALAQVEVMEPGDSASSGRYPAASQRESRKSAPAPSSDATAELYNQVLQLQEEVRQLRGQVEEQSEQLRQLKQQRLDDYIGLDRRISALGGGAQAPSSPGGEAPPAGPMDDQSMSSGEMPDDAIRADVAPTPPPTPHASVPVQGEEPAYQAAYELVRNRRFPEATTAFNDFLQRFPQGAMAGNAHYWLGELYLLEGDSDSARKQFESLVYQFPDNQKLADGMFKLGRIYHQQGDSARAKELLQRAANESENSGSSAPRLARAYLQENFPGQ
jgi:tol-pal system protein YbgF